MINYLQKNMDVICKSILSVDDDCIEKLINDCIVTLDNGGRVVATGLGKNVPVCEKFVGTMLSLGKNAYFMNTNSAVHGDIGIVNENDVVIVLTKSGETTESVYLTDLLLKRNAIVWLLSFRKHSTLADKLEKKIILSLDDEGDMWNIVPNNSTAVNLIILQSIAIEVARRSGTTLDIFKKNHPGGYIGVQLSNE